MTTAMWAKLETRPFLFIRSFIELALAYIFASLALDSGSLIQYAVTVLFLTLFLRNLIKGITYKPHGKR